MNGKMNIYYDEEGDYLEIFIEGYRGAVGEEIGNDITLFKDEKTGQVVGVGIFNFKKRALNLKDVLSNLPISIKIEPTSQ